MENETQTTEAVEAAPAKKPRAKAAKKAAPKKAVKAKKTAKAKAAPKAKASPKKAAAKKAAKAAEIKRGMTVKFTIKTRFANTHGKGIVKALPPKGAGRGATRCTVKDADGNVHKPYITQCKPA